MPQDGMRIQIEGSPHPWLEERGDKLILLLAVDDATSAVTQAVFHPSEETRICLAVLEGLVRQWEIPLALYSNRHAAFKYNAHQGPVHYEFTQVARVIGELGIQQIFAMSPQAKSRGLSLSPFTRALGMSRVATRKYALAESPPTKLLIAKEHAKGVALVMAQSQMAAD